MRKAVFFIALIAGAFALLPTKSSAYFDSFDTYATGSYTGGYWNSLYVNDTYYYTSAPNGMGNSYGTATSSRLTLPSAQTGQGQMVFHFNISQMAALNQSIIGFATTTGPIGASYFSYGTIYFDKVGSDCRIRAQGDTYTDYMVLDSCTGWHTMSLDYNLYAGTFTFTADGSESSEITFTVTEYPTAVDFTNFGSNYLYIDNFLISASATNLPYDFITSFDETDFFPTEPNDCLLNVLDYGSSTMTLFSVGHFTNPPDSGNTYDGLYMQLENVDTRATSVLTLLETEMAENTDSGWGGVFDIATGTYMVSYFATGKNILGTDQMFWHNCPGTLVTWNADYEEKLTWGICDLDDCSGVSWWDTLEKLWCYIKNAGISLICPSEDVWKKTQSMVSEIKQKAPFSYFSVAFSGVSDVIDDASSSVATSTVMGTATDIDYDGLAHAIKNMFGAVSGNIVTILYWAISGLLIWKFGFEIIKYLAKELYT